MNKKKNSKIVVYLCLVLVILSFVAFSLSISLIRSKQHIMQYGYTIGCLEKSCASYQSKIYELDKKILELTDDACLIDKTQSWVKDVNVHHVRKCDVQYFAFDKRIKNNQIVVNNSRKQ